LSKIYPKFITNVRGRGTFLAYDVNYNGADRDKLVEIMRNNGV